MKFYKKKKIAFKERKNLTFQNLIKNENYLYIFLKVSLIQN